MGVVIDAFDGVHARLQHRPHHHHEPQDRAHRCTEGISKREASVLKGCCVLDIVSTQYPPSVLFRPRFMKSGSGCEEEGGKEGEGEGEREGECAKEREPGSSIVRIITMKPRIALTAAERE